MIYLSKTFRRMLANDERNYQARAVIELMDGTRLTLTNEEIWSDGFAVEDAVSDDENFSALGATIINAGTLIIDNTKDMYTDYDFDNADVTMYISAVLQNGNTTWTEEIKMGTFRVDDPKYDEATITLSLLDMMEQFDRPYKESELIYPATLGAIVMDACRVCSVTLGTLTFPHDDFVISTAPADDAVTFREVIGWVATIAGCFARCNRDGWLELKWFNMTALENDTGTDGGIFDGGSPYYTTGDNLNGGTFNPWNDPVSADGGAFTDSFPVHYIGKLYSQNICVDDTVITGIKVIIEDDDPNAENRTLEFSRGTNGYCIQIEGNKFLNKNNVNTVLDWLATSIIGMRFRKCTVSIADDPSIEAGDVGILFDSRNREYPILITRHAFEVTGPQTIVCGSETPSRNSATRYSKATKSFVESRKLLKQQKDSYEQALEDLAEDIENNAHGLYVSDIEDPDNQGATIKALHDKPDIVDSAVQIRLSTVGIVVTANGLAPQPTWYGLRVNGDLIGRIMNTIGINFDWGVGGALQIKKNSQEVFYADADTGILRITAKKNNNNVFYLNSETGQIDIVANSFSLSNGSTIPSIAQAAVDSQSQLDIFNKLTNNQQNQGIYLSGTNLYINANCIKSGTILIKKGTQTTFSANASTGAVDIVANSFSLVSGSSTKSIPDIATEKASAAVNGQTQTDIFNKLTNNQQNQGIYLSGTNLYINADRINTGTMSANRIYGGTLSLGGNNNANGLLEIYDSSGTKVGTFNNTGIIITSQNGKYKVSLSATGGDLNVFYNDKKTGTFGSGFRIGDEDFQLVSTFLANNSYAKAISWEVPKTGGNYETVFSYSKVAESGVIANTLNAYRDFDMHGNKLIMAQIVTYGDWYYQSGNSGTSFSKFTSKTAQIKLTGASGIQMTLKFRNGILFDTVGEYSDYQNI